MIGRDEKALRRKVVDLVAENDTMLAELRALRARLEHCEKVLVGIHHVVGTIELPPGGRKRISEAEDYLRRWNVEEHDDECPCCDGTGVRP